MIIKNFTEKFELMLVIILLKVQLQQNDSRPASSSHGIIALEY